MQQLPAHDAERVHIAGFAAAVGVEDLRGDVQGGACEAFQNVTRREKVQLSRTMRQ
jgi:hypothetical protein